MLDKKRLIDTFLELVKIDSPSGEEQTLAIFIGKKLKTLGATVKNDSYGNLIANIKGNTDIPFMINAHLDTVEPGRSIKPFIKGDKIYSDGTTILGGDDKAGLAIILEVLRTLKENRLDHPQLEIVLTLGEESGLLGAMNLDYSMISSKQGITLDGHGKVSNVTISAPGYNRVDIQITGISAHAGVEPEKGLSAIKIASEIISKLKVGRIDFETTANIGLISGGSARNAIPELVEFKGEIRSRNMKKLQKHTEHFKNVLEIISSKYTTAKIETVIKEEFTSYSFTKDHPIIQKILQTFKKLKIKPDLGVSGGGSDVNIFNSHGIEIVDVGIGVYNPHTKREYLVISETTQTANFLLQLLNSKKS